MENQLSSPLRVVARKETALESVELAIEVFDKLFHEVATVNLYNEQDIGGDLKIPKRNLTDKQCRSIKELSGHIISIKRNLMERRDSETTPARLTEHLTGKEAGDLHTARKFSLLQEYLVNELNRSEAAELQLKAKEDELVLVTAERDKLKKRLVVGSSSSHSLSALAASAPSSTAASTSAVVKVESSQHPERGDANPLSYVGGYIRKPFGNSYFFGLIAAYLQEDAFFQIVYEDADYEDLSFAEMRRVLWSGSTPTAKREACTKHAKLLGILTEEQCTAMAAQGAAGQPPAGKASTPFLQSAKGSAVSSGGVKSSVRIAAVASSSSSSSGSSESPRADSVEEAAPSCASSAVSGVRAVLKTATVSDTSSSSGAGGGASDNDSSRDSADGTAPMRTSAVAAAPASATPAVAAPIAQTQSSSSLSSLPPALSQQSTASASSSTAPQGSASAPGALSAPIVLPANAGDAADKSASNPAGVPRLLELQQIARMHHPAPSLSAVSSASKEKPKSLSRSQPTLQASKTSCQASDHPLAAPSPQAAFSQLSSASTDTVVESFQGVASISLTRTATTGSASASDAVDLYFPTDAPAHALVAIPPNTLTALVRANQARAEARVEIRDVDSASDDSSVVFLETRSNGAVELVSARGGKRPYRAAAAATNQSGSTGKATAAAKKHATGMEKSKATSSTTGGSARVMQAVASDASLKRKAEDAAQDDASGKKKSAADAVNVVPMHIN